MKTINFILIFLLALTYSTAQETVNISEIEFLNNTQWEGQLTYKDYSSGELTSIDATQQVRIEGNKLMTSFQYTYEPNKNNYSTIRIRKNGTYLGKEKVLSNTLKDNTRTIVTVFKGKDNNKKAMLYKTYQFSELAYSVTKEVAPDDGSERFVRNTYQFKRVQK